MNGNSGHTSQHSAEFDSFADSYSNNLHAGLSVTGETQEHFARERIRVLAGRLTGRRVKVNRVLDFGCGQGSSTPLLQEQLDAKFAVGAEVSRELLEIARRMHAGPALSYIDVSDVNAIQPFDLVYMNGVLHHVPGAERLATLRTIFDAMVPGGLFAFWENNPWNPGTRYVMSRIAFDRDAKTLSIPESKVLLRQAGFVPQSVDTVFFFPKLLAFLRPLEKFLSVTQLGGQYMILCEKR